MVRNRATKSTKKDTGDLFNLSIFKMSGEDHEKFKKGMHDRANDALQQFPNVTGCLTKIFTETDPPQLLACFASYSFRRYVGSDGLEPHTTFMDVQQFHGEFLQALLLTIPADDWGQFPVTPKAVQKVFDAIPKVSEMILAEGIASTPDNLGVEELIIRGLQQRVKFHTSGVRNWGYFQDVVKITRDLLAPLDSNFRNFHGFSGQELVQVLLAIINEFEDRQNQHFQILRKIARGKNYRQVIRLYFKLVPDLKGSSEEMISALPIDFPKRDAIAMVMSHLDLRLADYAAFSPTLITNLTGIEEAVARRILNAVSLAPGSLADRKPEFFFLDNPVWDRPAVKFGDDNFFFAMPQAAFSHINKIIDRLAKEAKLNEKMANRRADFLEERLLSVITKALPTATIRSGVKWTVGGTQYETDLLVVQDRIVLIGEAKSHRLTPEGMRGAPKRVKRHIDDLVISPSLQSARLEKLIEDAKSGDETAVDVVKAIGIDPAVIDRVIRFSVTLDDLSVLGAAEQDFKKIGWLPEGHKLAPTILISDLVCIVEILDNPLLFYHYISERYYFQKSFDVLGDELDFLGLYLVSCFNLAGLQNEQIRLSPTGMSAPIDRYFESQQVGASVLKPNVELGRYFRDVVERLSQQQPDGWTSVGMHLLSCADPKEQRQIDKDIAKIKGIVRSKFRDPQHICSLQIRPPEGRKALVILHFFPKQLKFQMRAVVESLVADAMQDGGIEACALISQNIDNRKSPYEAAALALKG